METELDRGTWQQAAARVQRVALAARVLWWVSILAPPLVAVVAFPDRLLEALIAAVVSLVFVRRVVFGIGAGSAVDSWREQIGAAGPQLSRTQVAQLLHDGMAPGDGGVWLAVQEGTRVRVVAEGRAPGAPARSSSPWVWAMGGGGM